MATAATAAADASAAEPAAESGAVPPGRRIGVSLRAADADVRLVVQMRGRLIRIEQGVPGDPVPRLVLLHQGDRGRLILLDPARRTYVSLDRDWIGAPRAPVRAMRAEVDLGLRALPAAQRGVIERVLGLRGATESPILVRALAGEDRVGDLSCRRHELVRDGAPLAEICLADWEDVGIRPEDLEVFRQLVAFQRELLGAGGPGGPAWARDHGLAVLVQLDGFPLRLRGVGPGARLGEIRVTEVAPLRATASDRTLFAPPADYRAQSAYSLLGGETAVPDAAPAPAPPPAAPTPR